MELGATDSGAVDDSRKKREDKISWGTGLYLCRLVTARGLIT